MGKFRSTTSKEISKSFSLMIFVIRQIFSNTNVTRQNQYICIFFIFEIDVTKFKMKSLKVGGQCNKQASDTIFLMFHYYNPLSIFKRFSASVYIMCKSNALIHKFYKFLFFNRTVCLGSNNFFGRNDRNKKSNEW